MLTHTTAMNHQQSNTLAEPKTDTESSTHIANINAYYDSAAVLLFEEFFRQQIHLGYWDDKYPNVSLEQAAMRLTQVVLECIALPKEGRLLDIGCGCGAPAIEIARQRQCFVEGVTINPQQKDKADQLISESGMGNQVSVSVANACALPFDNGTYDSALLLESIHHIGHKQALIEAHRVLKAGGEIIIADGAAIKPDISIEDKTTLGEIFVANSLVTAEELSDLMSLAGFEITKRFDLSAAILPTWSKLIKQTELESKKIISDHGVEFYHELMSFWVSIKDLWQRSASYLLIKGRKI